MLTILDLVWYIIQLQQPQASTLQISAPMVSLLHLSVLTSKALVYHHRSTYNTPSSLLI